MILAQPDAVMTQNTTAATLAIQPTHTVSHGPSGATISIVCIANSGTTGAPIEFPPATREWVESDPELHGAPAIWMTFQGTHIHWAPGRCAILAPEDRLEGLRAVIADATKHELALRALEREMEGFWTDLDADAAFTFEFNEASVALRPHLRAKLRAAVLMRARLARIAPYLLLPLVYPPTLASQVAERLRERLRMPSRHEAAVVQMEVIRDTYEVCGQRASEFMVARTGHILEIIIIVLLAVQLLLGGLEYLTAVSN